MLKQRLKYVKSRIREAAAHVRAPRVLRRKQSRGGCLSKRAKSCQLAHQGAWKRWVLKQGLNYVKLRIREAAAQAQAESRPRPKTYSWTAAFVLRAPFAVAKCVACVSTCVREETVKFSACAKRYHATKNSCGLAPQAHRSLAMRKETCSCKTTAAISHRPID